MSVSRSFGAKSAAFLAKLERHLYAVADQLRQEGLDAATYNQAENRTGKFLQ